MNTKNPQPTKRRRGGEIQPRQEIQKLDPQDHKETPERLSIILGRPPILTGEDEAAFRVVLQWLSETIEPRDFVEVLWLKDLAVAVWEAERNSQLKSAYIEKLRGEQRLLSMAELLQHHKDPTAKARDVLAELMMSKDPEAAISNWFSSYGRDYSSVLPTAYRANLQGIERFDQLIETAQHKRDRLIRQIEERRADQAKSGARLLEISATKAPRPIDDVIEVD